MPHAVSDVMNIHTSRTVQRKSRAKASARDIQHTMRLLEDAQTLYSRSCLSQSMAQRIQILQRTTSTPITRVLSLGLGSLQVVKGQTRRIKQLAILLAVRKQLQQNTQSNIEVFAQDPTFTRADEALLASLSIQILRTPSGAELGEASSVLSSSTLVYSPFLTVDAYEQLLVKSPVPPDYILGDDFNALQGKWPRHSEERKQVEGVMKLGLSPYRRKAVDGEGFWVDEDASFPMAMYEKVDKARQARIRAKI